MRTGRIRSPLRLDRQEGLVAGVCAGVARWLHVDPTWVRVAALVVALFATLGPGTDSARTSAVHAASGATASFEITAD